MPDSAMAWRCIVCGYLHRGPEPPDVCPTCGAAREDFEPVQDAAEAAPAEGKAKRVLVIGAGIAGTAAAESIRATAPSTEIVLISQEAEVPYYRLNLTRYLAGEISRQNLPMHPAAWYDEQHIQLLLSVEVAGLLLEDHAVALRDGRRLAFERLLLAAGAHPFVPPIPGSALGGVTSLRTIDDADYLLEACKAGVRCVCIGGGLLGLETAGGLARQGADVTLLEGHGWLLPRQLNQTAGEILGTHVSRLGINLRKHAATREISGSGRVEHVILEDGSTIPADLVVIATGVRANTSLARQAGLEVNHGVVVNDRLTTSHPDVLAAGDVAEHKGVVYGLWTASQAQGAIAGTNLAGGSAEFGGLPRSTTLKVLGLDLFSIGQINPEAGSDQVIDQESEGRYFRFVFRENHLAGAILLGDLKLVSSAKKAVEGKRDCSSLLRSRRLPRRSWIFSESRRRCPGRDLPQRRAARPRHPTSPGHRSTSPWHVTSVPFADTCTTSRRRAGSGASCRTTGSARVAARPSRRSPLWPEKPRNRRVTHSVGPRPHIVSSAMSSWRSTSCCSSRWSRVSGATRSSFLRGRCCTSPSEWSSESRCS